MPLAVGDYLADTGHLTTIEHGAYLLLLMHYWRKGPLPNDLARVASICKLPKDAWSIAKRLLDEFFRVQADGLLHQKRSDKEIEDWQGKRQKAQQKARVAAEARWGNNTPSIALSNSQSTAPSMEQALLEDCPLPAPLPTPIPIPTPEPSPSPEKASPSAPRADTREKEIVESIFAFYCEKFQRDPRRYQLTAERRKKAGLRFRERLKANKGNEAAVEIEFSQAVENLAASEYHVTQGYTDWLAQIFRSEEEFEKRLNWRQGARNGHGNHTRNQESVLDRIQRERAEAAADPGRSGASAADAGPAAEPTPGASVGSDPPGLDW